MAFLLALPPTTVSFASIAPPARTRRFQKKIYETTRQIRMVGLIPPFGLTDTYLRGINFIHRNVDNVREQLAN